MNIADRFDQIVSGAQRTTASATAAYEQRVAVLGERVRLPAENERHRRGITRESIARGGAILLPADDIDLSPHSPVADASPLPESVDVTRALGDPSGAFGPGAGDTGPHGAGPHGAGPHEAGPFGSSYETGWLTDR